MSKQNEQTKETLKALRKHLRKAKKLLDDATDFFGPCWCKKSIGFKCPQCWWRADYAKFEAASAPKPKVDPK